MRFSPPSGPAHRLFQEPPGKSKFLAVIHSLKILHPDDNIIAVGVRNNDGAGGLNPDVNVELVGKSGGSPWSRSLFSGFAQIMVQSTKDVGEIKLTATADGLTPTTATLQTVVRPARPSVP